MAKTRTSYFCQNCGAQHAKWQGQCHSCREWNTLVEEVLQKEKKSWNGTSSSKSAPKPFKIAEIEASEEARIHTGNRELDRVLGGGFVPGSITLLGGEPGIGKSTLLLQIALLLRQKVLYVSGEESLQQIKMRADRIQKSAPTCYVLAETRTQNIFQQISQLHPDLVILDSIQTLHSDHVESGPGSISQIRECTAELIRYAKESSVPVVLIGHINKEGSIAGPKVLEHMVDTVLQFEGDRNHAYRILRAHKNRFGSTSELGIYEMYGAGLREITDPSDILISQNEDVLSGTAVAATIEGMRPLLIEIQALVSTAVYGTPQRSSTGYNSKRLNMILAVLEKRAGFRLASKDVFLNVTGGISVDDPALDLAVVAAILSSNEDIAVPRDTCFAAEVGLAGELRPVPRVEQRILEAEKLGFNCIVISKQSKLPKQSFSIAIKRVSRIEQIAENFFG